MKKPLLILGLIIVAFLGYQVYTRYYARNSRNIFVSGNIEATTVDVSFKIPGRVVKRFVDEGVTVKKGDLIAKLDTAQLNDSVNLYRGQLLQAKAALAELLNGSRPQEVAVSKAAYEHAQFALLELLNGSRPEEIKAAQAAMRQAKAMSQNAHDEFLRQKELFEQGYVSYQAYENAETADKTNRATLRQTQAQSQLTFIGPRQEQIDQARQNVAQAKEQYLLVKEGPRKEDIDQGRARIVAAQASLDQALNQLRDATLYAPLSGVVLSKNVEPGEFVSAGTAVVTIGDLKNVWLRAYVDESDLGRIKFDQPATVTTDTYRGKTYPGRISFISSQSEFTPKNIQTQVERVKLVYRIKIDISNPNLELKPGMPADAKI